MVKWYSVCQLSRFSICPLEKGQTGTGSEQLPWGGGRWDLSQLENVSLEKHPGLAGSCKSTFVLTLEAGVCSPPGALTSALVFPGMHFGGQNCV